MVYPTAPERDAFRQMARTLLEFGELDWTPATVLVFEDWLDELSNWDSGPPPPPPFE